MPPKNRDFSEKCSLQAICSIWAALPGAHHLERCFAPKAGGKRHRDHLCDRLASEQFPYLDQMISYPEIYSPCLSMRLINILIEGNIFSSHRKVEIFEKFRIFWKTNQILCMQILYTYISVREGLRAFLRFLWTRRRLMNALEIIQKVDIFHYGRSIFRSESCSYDKLLAAWRRGI